MADNVLLNAGTGGDTVAADDISSVKYQRIKLIHGADGVNAGDVSTSNPLPAAVPVVNSTGNITTQNLVPAGTATAGSAVEATITNQCLALVQVTGTYTGPLSLQYTVDGGTWVTHATGNDAAFFNVNTGLYSFTIASGTTGIFRIPVAGAVKIRITGLAAMTGTAVVTINASSSVWANQTNQNMNQNLVGGATITVNNGTAGSGTQRVVIASDQTAYSVNATGPTLTKATQGATGFSVQDLKDAGRTALRYYAVAAAAGTTTTETAITLTKSSGTSATTTGTSFVITSGKIFRITAMSFATRGHNTATAQTTTFNFRINTGGAVTTSSTPITLAMRSATPATANAWDRVFVQIPDGLEITGDGTLQFGVTAAATYTTNAPTWDVTIIGFEY